MEVYGQQPGWPPESLAYFTNQDSRGVKGSYATAVLSYATIHPHFCGAEIENQLRNEIEYKYIYVNIWKHLR